MTQSQKEEQTIKNIGAWVEKRAKHLLSEWREKNPYFFTDNGYEPNYERFLIKALIEYLEQKG